MWQAILDDQFAQHSPEDPQRGKAAPVSRLLQEIHRLVQSLLPPDDPHQSKLLSMFHSINFYQPVVTSASTSYRCHCHLAIDFILKHFQVSLNRLCGSFFSNCFEEMNQSIVQVLPDCLLQRNPYTSRIASWDIPITNCPTSLIHKTISNCINNKPRVQQPAKKYIKLDANLIPIYSFMKYGHWHEIDRNIPH